MVSLQTLRASQTVQTNLLLWLYSIQSELINYLARFVWLEMSIVLYGRIDV